MLGTSVGLLWKPQWTFGFHKMRGISWLSEELLASQEALRFLLGLFDLWRWYRWFVPKRQYRTITYCCLISPKSADLEFCTLAPNTCVAAPCHPSGTELWGSG
jgi:hypothetical protein